MVGGGGGGRESIFFLITLFQSALETDGGVEQGDILEIALGVDEERAHITFDFNRQ